MSTDAILPRRRALSPRLRFEVFKRDAFTCRYCGRKTPTVVLQVDHVIPIADGGADDPINLVTSCWECNSGKSDVPLADVITGEDPHDRAIMLLEQERQLQEYNDVRSRVWARQTREAELLREYWEYVTGITLRPEHNVWLMRVLETVPTCEIQEAMDIAITNNKCRDLRYVMACVRNWKTEGKWPVSGR